MASTPLIIILLILVGGLLIFGEFFLPGGILGAIGGLCLLAMVILVFVAYGPMYGGIALAGAAVSGAVYTGLFLKYFSKTFLGKKFSLKAEVQGKSVPMMDAQTWLGSQGEAATTLRPAGKALINGVRMEVVAESGMISAGQKVQVVRVAGARLIVRAIEP